MADRPSIYGLTDPKTGKLRYIGKANDPASRLRGHMRECRRKTPLYDWIQKVGKPGLVILESDCQDWVEAERRLIAEARARGERLLNIADGGDEPFCSTATRANNGAKVAVARSHALWSAYRRLGASSRYFQQRGDTLRAEKMEAAVMMLKQAEKRARRLGFLPDLERRLLASRLAEV